MSSFPQNFKSNQWSKLKLTIILLQHSETAIQSGGHTQNKRIMCYHTHGAIYVSICKKMANASKHVLYRTQHLQYMYKAQFTTSFQSFY